MAAPKKPAPKKTVAKKAPAKAAAPKAAPAKSNNTKTVLIIVGVLVLIFVIIPAIALTAGGIFLGNKLNENGVNVDTSQQEGSVNIKDKNGNEINVGGTQKLPNGFPSDIPLYDGKITASGKVTVDGKTGWTVTISTSDSLDTVGSWNTSQYSSNGWTTNLDTASGSGGLLTATNGTYRVSAFSNNEDGTTTVLYTVTPESQE